MKNRAKCKVCSTIIESFHVNDHVSCNCGEIAIDGGPGEFRCYAKSFDNFLRVDDEGNEIVVTVKEKEEKPNKKELLDMLQEMIIRIEGLPPAAMLTPISHYDFYAGLILLKSILSHEDK